MDADRLLVTATAEACRAKMEPCSTPDASLPAPLQLRHLQWMCLQIERHAETWTATKLNRWIGFIQCGMLANRLVDLEGLKAMFAQAKVAYGKGCEDIADHLDPTSDFELEIGGEQ